MKRIVFLSGGIGSWAAGMRVMQKYGSEDIINLFTDTKKKNDKHPHRGEDQDLYRFLSESWGYIGGELEWISVGKHIWQVFEEARYMGNTRHDPCSRILKREAARSWIEKRFSPDEITLYLGIDWTEEHRAKKCVDYWKPYNVEFPLIDEPYLSKSDMCDWVERYGVRRPRLYDMGFSHNNCGGFCVKGGQGHFFNLLNQMPERYAYHEAKQEELFLVIGKRVPFIRKSIDKEISYLSLREFREKIQKDEMNNISKIIDLNDIGGCGCFNDV